MSKPLFVGHEIYRRSAYGSFHPLAIPRVETAVDLCAVLGWLGEDDYEASPCASEQELARFHDRDYVRALRAACEAGRADAPARERFSIGTMENPIFPGRFERASPSVGGSVLAARRALEGRLAYHPAGGTHHGRPGRASGFCYFNDPVFAVLMLLDLGLERVAYVDLDAHHCDAVQDAFSAEPRVRTASIHEAGRWPGTGALDDDAGGRALNLPVPRGFHDAELRLIMDEVLLPFVSAFRPQAVVLTCGADAVAGDPLAAMALSNRALWDAALAVTRLAPAAVVLGGGGYNPWTVARYWSGLWARLSGHAIPPVLPDFARAILEPLSCDLVEDEDVRPEWKTTIEDAANEQRVRPPIVGLREAALARHALHQVHA